jgi:NADPH2:quinone reductase
MDTSKYGGKYNIFADIGLESVFYKKVVCSRHGAPDVLKIDPENELSEPGKGQVRVRVFATSASVTDALIRQGKYQDAQTDPPFVLGSDMVGVVDAVGPDVENLREDQWVADLTITGSYSEYMIVDAKNLTVIPKDIDPAEGVSLVMPYVAAYQMLHRSTSLTSGQKILIHGAGRSIGRALVQLGSLMGLEIYITGAKLELELVDQYGCHPIDSESEDFVQKMNELESEGVDAVFDPFSKDHFQRSMKVLSPTGELIVYGHNAKSKGILSCLLACLVIGRSPTYYSINAWYKQHHAWYTADLTALFDLLKENKIKPLVSKKMTLDDAREAHELLENGNVLGNIVLLVDEELHETNSPDDEENTPNEESS